MRVDDGPVVMEVFPESTGPNRARLPPAEADLAPLDHYLELLDTEPKAAELGLLGRWHYLREPEAEEALMAHYVELGYTPPRSFASET